MTSSKRAVARADREGYIQVAIVQPSGCLARLEAWAKSAGWVALWFGLGVLVGELWRVLGS